MPPFTPEKGDLVILKGGIVGRILRLDGEDRVLAQTWYPIERARLVPFTQILDRATVRPVPPGLGD
jgi:preprotein translocase subunit YajC